MQKFRYFIVHHKKRLLIFLVIFIILGIIFFPRQSKPLETEKVKRTDIVESLTTTGTIVSENAVELSFLTSGKLVFVGAKKGDEVKAGQVIATLDQRTIQKNLQSSLKDYAKERNDFEQSKADNQDKTPQTALNDSMRRILENNQYDLDKAVLSVELQTLAREQSVLVSPISGIVTQADVTTPGVTIGLTDVFKIADPNTLKFTMDIDEADIGKVKIGQDVKVSFDAYPDDQLTLTINAIDFASHTTTSGGNAFSVDATLPQSSDLSYRVGMSGDGEVILDQEEDVPVISLSSVTEDNYVYVKKEKGFEKRKIKTGIQSDTEVEVIKGLSEGEEVALDPEEADKQVVTKKSFGLF